MKYLIRSLLHLLPVVIFFIFEALVPNEAITFIFLIFLSVFYFYFTGFKKREAYLLALGIIIGFLIETVLGNIYRQQLWLNASLWGVPTWLPLVWGVGFVIIRRLGDILVLHRNKL